MPRYLHIEASLRSRIASLKPGDRLPSEAELCHEFGVSRMTARHALQALTGEGHVYRVPGRGTFVGQPPFHRHAGRLFSFSEEMRLRSRVPSSKLLYAGIRQATAEERVALQLAPGDRVAELHRLRFADEVPMAIERAVLIPGLAAALRADLENGSLHEHLRAMGCVPAAAKGSLMARNGTEADAELLGVPLGDALLVEQRIVFDESGTPIECTESRYVGERYVFDVSLERDPNARKHAVSTGHGPLR